MRQFVCELGRNKLSLRKLSAKGVSGWEPGSRAPAGSCRGRAGEGWQAAAQGRTGCWAPGGEGGGGTRAEPALLGTPGSPARSPGPPLTEATREIRGWPWERLQR